MTTISEPVVLRPRADDGGELREMTRLEKAVGPEWRGSSAASSPTRCR